MRIGPGSFAMIARPQLWETDPARQQCNRRQPFKETRMGPDAHGEPIVGLRPEVLENPFITPMSQLQQGIGIQNLSQPFFQPFGRCWIRATHM